MTEFIKRLFGNQDKKTETDMTVLFSTPKVAWDLYHSTITKWDRAFANKDFQSTAHFIQENVRQIPDYIEETKQRCGACFPSFPVLGHGGTILAVLGDYDGLIEIQKFVLSIPELASLASEVEKHIENFHLVSKILELINSKPGCIQNDVKNLIGIEDWRRVAHLIFYLEKAGRIVKIRQGGKNRLFLSVSPGAPALPPKQIVGSHRADGRSPMLNKIDISSVSYVPLPRSPYKWEEKIRQQEISKFEPAKEPFEIRDADWVVSSVTITRQIERPDPAFRRFYSIDSGLLMIDDRGKAEGLGLIEASAICYNRAGVLSAKAGLLRRPLRIGVHPFGRELITLSDDYVVHTYDDKLQPVFETSLADAPETQSMRARFEVPIENLPGYMRCIALSQDATRYLFTIVDEAWCIDIGGGRGLWGAKLPMMDDGWERAVKSSIGVSADISKSLALMELSLPVTPEQVKRRYRELAKQWHPDLNPGDSLAEQKMKKLNSAAEMLTGIDVSSLGQSSESMFARPISKKEVAVGDAKFTVRIEFFVHELSLCDWIYAVSFAADSSSVYLGGYSGRVFLVDENGVAIRVYDIGCVPRRIVDTGTYLYLLTDTRLYVLREDALHALIDTFDVGNLVTAESGFGLIEKKRLRWFSPCGDYLGCVVSKDPIQRVYSTAKGLVVETRQRRAVIKGAPRWWRAKSGSVGGAVVIARQNN